MLLHGNNLHMLQCTPSTMGILSDSNWNCARVSQSRLKWSIPTLTSHLSSTPGVRKSKSNTRMATLQYLIASPYPIFAAWISHDILTPMEHRILWCQKNTMCLKAWEACCKAGTYSASVVIQHSGRKGCRGKTLKDLTWGWLELSNYPLLPVLNWANKDPWAEI